MDETQKQEEENSPEEKTAEKQEDLRTPWQRTKEGWYDKIPLTLHQLDIIVHVCLVLLGLCFIAICLDALGVF